MTRQYLARWSDAPGDDRGIARGRVLDMATSDTGEVVYLLERQGARQALVLTGREAFDRSLQVRLANGEWVPVSDWRVVFDARRPS